MSCQDESCEIVHCRCLCGCGKHMPLAPPHGRVVCMACNNEIRVVADREDAEYGVVDGKTGEVVYRTTYRHRRRARAWADRKDNEYGGYRYTARFLDVITSETINTLR